MDDLISEFISETSDSIASLDDALLRHPSDAQTLGAVCGIMHTIKGTCGFLGLPRLERVAQAAHQALGKIRDKGWQDAPQAAQLVADALAGIRSLIDYLGEHGQEEAGDDDALVARLQHFSVDEVLGEMPVEPAPALDHLDDIIALYDTPQRTLDMADELALACYRALETARSGRFQPVIAPLQHAARLAARLKERLQIEEENADEMKSSGAVDFLTFTLGAGAPKAVLLEQVLRVEMIGVKAIEIAGDQPVAQYRGELMRLVSLGNGLSLPNTGMMEVIVFRHGERYTGLVVDKITGIAAAPFALQLPAKEAYLGSLVIAGKVTDIVDVAWLADEEELYSSAA